MPRKNSTSILSDSEIDAFKESFCRDGYIGEEGQVELVFVLKESNVSNEHDRENLKPEIDDTFWFKSLVRDKTKAEKNKYYRCLSMMSEKHVFDLGNCAYVNIQKRGGYSNTNIIALNNYALMYKYFIKKEIEILKPKKIICLGTFEELVNLVYNTSVEDVSITKEKVELKGVQKVQKELERKVADITLNNIDSKNSKVKCIGMYHPAARICEADYEEIFTQLYIEGERNINNPPSMK
jgi:hypothetical protein